LIAGFLYSHYIKLLFLGNVAAVLIVCIIVYIYISETLPHEIRSKNRNGSLSTNRENLLALLLKKPIVLYFSLVSIFFYLVFNQLFFSLPLQINDIFGNAGPYFFGILMSFNCFTVVSMIVPITIISKKSRPLINIFFSGILFAVGFGMFYWINQFGWVLFSTFIWTMGEILLRVNAGVYIANHSPATHRGRVNSLITISDSISRIIGPPLCGLIIINLGIRQVWVFTFLISICGSGLVYLLYLAEKNSN